MPLERGDSGAACCRRVARAGGLQRQGARWRDRHLRRHHPADAFRSVSPSIRSSRTSTPARTARSCRRPSATTTACRRSPSSASSSCRSTAWEREPLEGVPRRRLEELKDAGFPDRILWHKAVAAKYPSYDVSRVGIYGGSAGGQNAMGALLFHPDFYKAAVAFAGCHDNRMDKIWWNEQWMGWPIGPHYAASSNIVNAWRTAAASCCSSSPSSTRTSIRHRRCRS